MTSERERVLGMFPEKAVELLKAVVGYLTTEAANEAKMRIIAYREFAQMLLNEQVEEVDERRIKANEHLEQVIENHRRPANAEPYGDLGMFALSQLVHGWRKINDDPELPPEISTAIWKISQCLAERAYREVDWLLFCREEMAEADEKKLKSPEGVSHE